MALPGTLPTRAKIGHDLEIDVATVAVPPGQPLPDVLVDLVLAVLALLEPPESFGLGGHALDDGQVGEPDLPSMMTWAMATRLPSVMS